MTKFGKFKLRLIATVNLSLLLSIFNIASSTSNYWVKLVDRGNTHFAGLWRFCPNQSGCEWRDGIIDNAHSFWAWFVRFFMAFGSIFNMFALFMFFMAMIYKFNNKSKLAITIMEWANFVLIVAFIVTFIGFWGFLCNSFNYSIWLFMFSMIFMIITSNLITRYFAFVYFHNTRFSSCSKSTEANEKCNQEEGITNESPLIQTNTENMGSIEMNKIIETNEVVSPSIMVMDVQN